MSIEMVIGALVAGCFFAFLAYRIGRSKGYFGSGGSGGSDRSNKDAF